MQVSKIFISVICIFIIFNVHAQEDKRQLATSSVIDTTIKLPPDTSSAKITTDTLILAKDTIPKKTFHDPRKATRRSALVPGWGQAYNREYWKIPIVYGAISIPTVLFIYNNKWYKKTRDAYTLVVSSETDRYGEIDPKLINQNTGQPLDAQSLQYYRNDFRKNRDYSVLFFLLAWGINVVDATVFGHLKDFDVSDDLSLNVKPTFNPSTKTIGFGLALNIKTPPHKVLQGF